MEERNRVNVKIYGHEFTISGDMPRDHIIKVADYVDGKMHELAASMPACSVSSLAVLTAVNMADEYYRTVRSLTELKIKNQQIEKDAQHYVQLWDEAKKNFMQYKDDAQSALEHKEELQRLYNEKSTEYNELLAKYQELKEREEVLQRKNENLTSMLESQKEEKESSSSVVKELESRYRDIENSFFDLQMENIQLKGELDRYRKIADKDE